MLVIIYVIIVDDYDDVCQLLMDWWILLDMVIVNEFIDVFCLLGYIVWVGEELVGLVIVIKCVEEWEIFMFDFFNCWGGVGSWLLQVVVEEVWVN